MTEKYTRVTDVELLSLPEGTIITAMHENIDAPSYTLDDGRANYVYMLGIRNLDKPKQSTVIRFRPDDGVYVQRYPIDSFYGGNWATVEEE